MQRIQANPRDRFQFDTGMNRNGNHSNLALTKNIFLFDTGELIEINSLITFSLSILLLNLSREICREDGIYENDYNNVIPNDKLFNVWHDMVIHAKWGEEGFLKLFVNGENQ